LDYYPDGGGGDFIRASNSLDELKFVGEIFLDELGRDFSEPDWCHIFDLSTMSVVVKLESWNVKWVERGGE
jgi:hypothetical protein